ncbi:MAG: hypothetical protein IT379_27965 [Deltaproteobacteria bacterium]|nr:hypothetical protein [Deltaproteobacteria bacterium]
MRLASIGTTWIALATAAVLSASVGSNGLEAVLDVVHHAVGDEAGCADDDVGDCDDECPPACGDCGDCARCLRVLAPIESVSSSIAPPAGVRLAPSPMAGAPASPEPAEILVVPRA